MSQDLTLQFTFEKLDRDLRYLMQCFQEVLVELGQDALARALPWVGDETAAAAEALGAEDGLQALSLAFQLLNMVEENTSAQTRRQVEHLGRQATEPGLWGQRLAELRAQGFGAEEIAAALPEVWVEPVLTAHPTEAKRSSMLEQHRQLYLLLFKRENSIWTPAEQDQIRAQIKAALERIWRTGEILPQKPDVAAERRGVLYFLREVFPEVLPRLDFRLVESWRESGLPPELLRGVGKLPRLTFGVWVGGDRDGNPNVTAKTTEETLLALRQAALEVHDRNLLALAQRLSMTAMRQPPPSALARAIRDDAARLGETGRRALERNPDQPWRQYLNLVRAKLPQPENCTVGLAPYQYRRPAEFRRDLQLLYDSLLAIGAPRLAEQEALPAIRAAEVFGFHLAALDIRQNSARHDLAAAQLLTAAGVDAAEYPTWPPAKRLEFLRRELQSPQPLTRGGVELGAAARETLECYRLLASHGEEYGYDGLGSLIVSMTRSAADLLVVFLFAREAGLLRPSPAGPTCRLPVTPLFETVEDLAAAPAILREFLREPFTRANHISFGGRPLQQVMLGYSDSAKAAGLVSGQWALHRAQQALHEVAREAGVGLLFFHGRGGTISRGAGPTHRFLEALPHGSLCGAFRTTEQGETISQKYANLNTATFHLELLTAGVAATKLIHTRPLQTDGGLTPVLDALAARSQAAYEALLAAPGFLAFFGQATPIDAIEEARIGSRPSRRTGRRTLDDLRAIPWVFSWNQARFYLPGWYGVGAALEELAANDPATFAALGARAATWPVWRYLLMNIETSLASVDPEIMAQYAALVTDPAIRRRFLDDIAAEYRRTRDTLARLLGGGFEARRPRLWDTLVRRAPALRLLHRMQIAALAEWRDALRNNDANRVAAALARVLLSVNAVASGLRTTG